MIQIPQKLEQWVKALIAAIVSGFSNSVLAALGIGAANSVGMNVQPLHWKQILDIGFTGAFIGMVMYLKQSPVPPDSGNTDFIQKPTTQTQGNKNQ